VLLRLVDRMRFLLEDPDGATAVEYAIMVGFIAVAIVAGVTLFGTAVRSLFETWPGL